LLGLDLKLKFPKIKNLSIKNHKIALFIVSKNVQTFAINGNFFYYIVENVIKIMVS